MATTIAAASPDLGSSVAVAPTTTPTPPTTTPPTTVPPTTAPTATPPVEGDYKTLLAQGKALYGKGQAKKAIVPLEKAIAIKADGDEALVLLANCYLDRGNMEKALAAAQLAASANADNAEAYLVVGAVEQQKSHTSEARTAYEKYLKLAPKGQFASDIRSILATLR
jgi:Flp pilus assembly protein TadD